MILFADDSNLFLKEKHIEDIVSALNKEMNILVDWLRANRLSLNIDKTHYMVFTLKPKEEIPDLNILINGKKIERVRECKFLGLIIDEKFSWKEHIKYIATKAAKSIGIINKARKFFNKDTLLTLYYAFLYPLLLYGNVAWGNAPTSTLSLLYKVQKTVVRLILNN